MEIIHVVLGKANPARMNGVNKVVNQLAIQQSKAGEKVSVWGITGSLEHNYPVRNYNTDLFKAYKNRFRLSDKLLVALNDKINKAVFHLHGGFIATFYSLAKELHKRKIPFVFTPHGSYNIIAMQKSGFRKKIYFQLFEKKVLQYAGVIHCLGKSEMNGLQQLYPNSKSQLVPYGFNAQQIISRKIVVKEFLIGFCGRLDIHTKGLDVLLRAFTLFKKQVPHSTLWIIGDSNEKQQLESIAASLKISPHVVFHGSRYGEEKDQLLQSLDLFVHPSRNEGLPTSVLEAASMQIPCVVTEATNVGEGIRQYNCGEVIEEADEHLLFRALLNMYKKVYLQHDRSFGINARRMIQEKYNWDTVLQEFHQLYKKAC